MNEIFEMEELINSLKKYKNKIIESGKRGNQKTISVMRSYNLWRKHTGDLCAFTLTFMNFEDWKREVGLNE